MVITLVAIVSAVAVPQFIDFRADAKKAVTLSKLNTLRSAIVGDASSRRQGYISHMGAIPASLNDLVSQGAKPNYDPISKLGWSGPYVDGTVSDWNLDAWGTALSYEPANRRILSCGPNKTCNDADDLPITF